jgi:hypothetical protein
MITHSKVLCVWHSDMAVMLVAVSWVVGVGPSVCAAAMTCTSPVGAMQNLGHVSYRTSKEVTKRGLITGQRHGRGSQCRTRQ